MSWSSSGRRTSSSRPSPARRASKAEPIDIGDPEKRKAAFAALLEEEKASVAPAAQVGPVSKSLPPIVDALKQIGDLRMLELAATGADAGVGEDGGRPGRARRTS